MKFRRKIHRISRKPVSFRNRRKLFREVEPIKYYSWEEINPFLNERGKDIVREWLCQRVYGKELKNGN